MPNIFDKKNFNGEVFAKYMEKTPNLNRNELLKSKALKRRDDIKQQFADQVGGNYSVIPIFARLVGNKQNYDGSTDITSQGSHTYTQGRIVTGRADSWVENDFSYDITGGVDFLEQVAQQVGEYWDDVDQDTLISTLKGIFGMSGTNNAEFVEGHTFDISGNSGEEGLFGATTLNTGMQKAIGDNKAKFSLAVMHSAVVTNLENQNLVEYLKYTDAQGIERPTGLAMINGKLILMDDNMPFEKVDAVYSVTSDTALTSGKKYYTRSGSAGSYTYTAVATPDVDDIATYYELTTEAHTKYTSYVLGDGAIEYTDCGAKVPNETDRDSKKNGGQDFLISRQRKIFAPYGISFTDGSILSPTDAELETGSKWSLAHDGGTGNARKYFPHKAIPIARIISRG